MTTTFLNTDSDGDLGNPDNWDSGIPGLGDNAVIAASATTGSVDSSSIDIQGSPNDCQFTASGLLTIENGVQLTACDISAGTYSVGVSVTLDGGSASGTGQFALNGTALDGWTFNCPVLFDAGTTAPGAPTIYNNTVFFLSGTTVYSSNSTYSSSSSLDASAGSILFQGASVYNAIIGPSCLFQSIVQFNGSLTFLAGALIDGVNCDFSEATSIVVGASCISTGTPVFNGNVTFQSGADVSGVFTLNGNVISESGAVNNFSSPPTFQASYIGTDVVNPDTGVWDGGVVYTSSTSITWNTSIAGDAQFNGPIVFNAVSGGTGLTLTNGAYPTQPQTATTVMLTNTSIIDQNWTAPVQNLTTIYTNGTVNLNGNTASNILYLQGVTIYVQTGTTTVTAEDPGGVVTDAGTHGVVSPGARGKAIGVVIPGFVSPGTGFIGHSQWWWMAAE